MEDDSHRNHILAMAFGLPVITTLIVIGSMYAGHLMTVSSERPTEIRVQAAQPKIDVNVPQSPAPNIHVAAAAPQIDVHVPPAAPPAITVNTPPAAPPQITVNPAPATVTIIDKREPERPKSAAAPASAPAVVAPAAPKPAEPAAAQKPATAPQSSAADPLGNEPSLDNLYAHASRYIDLYCRKHGLDPANETRRWNNVWRANLDQAMNDNIDSSEQTYINRIVIAKRDYFNMNNNSPDKVVEACRILLRYRDGQLAWLQAMKDALTNENLRKTMTFLAQGP